MPLSSDYKILIVDDDKMNLDILKEIMKSKYTIATANSGSQAIEILPIFRPDLILLDIMMPGMNGYEVCERIRADQRYNFIKIILVSGKGLLEERLKGYEAGADDYVTKPFICDELDAKVRVFLRLKRAEEVDQIKNDLLTLFSHETRNPLNGIILSTELLLDDDKLSKESREYVEMIAESSHHLLDFVGKTKLLCELKSGMKFKKEPDYLKNHLKNIMQLFENKNQKKLSFQLDIQDDPEIKADWKLLNKAFNYVLENAVKYSPEGKKITIQAEQIENVCFIRITDQGQGIAPEWIDNIFNEFAIRNIMHHQKGQGLSLAIVRHILELHGGSIRVESLPGSGASFIFTLPIHHTD